MGNEQVPFENFVGKWHGFVTCYDLKGHEIGYREASIYIHWLDEEKTEMRYMELFDDGNHIYATFTRDGKILEGVEHTSRGGDFHLRGTEINSSTYFFLLHRVTWGVTVYNEHVFQGINDRTVYSTYVECGEVKSYDVQKFQRVS